MKDHSVCAMAACHSLGHSGMMHLLLLLLLALLLTLLLPPHHTPTHPHNHPRTHAPPPSQAHEELSDKARRRKFDMLLESEQQPLSSSSFRSAHHPYTR